MRFGFARAAALVAVMVLAGGATMALAHGQSAKSKVKITSGSGTHFEGVVTSKERKCVKHRKVTLVYDSAGYKDDVGKAKTDGSGAWSIDGSFTAGNYHAEVAKRTVGSITCKAAVGISHRF